jgi:hypothetical protein
MFYLLIDIVFAIRLRATTLFWYAPARVKIISEGAADHTEQIAEGARARVQV